VQIEEQNDGTRLTLRILCPGLRPDEISVVVDGGRVRVRAEHAEDSGTGPSRRRSSSVVAHAASIPAGTAAADVSAWLTDGVLEVRVPPVLGSGDAIAIPVETP
jgi:HSP20 family molecular chaperone IbpA